MVIWCSVRAPFLLVFAVFPYKTAKEVSSQGPLVFPFVVHVFRTIQAHFDPSRNCAGAIRSGVLSSGPCVAFSVVASCSFLFELVLVVILQLR